MKIYLLCFLLFFSSIRGDFSSLEMIEDTCDLDLSGKETLFVSLGYDCGIAMALRNFELRRFAFPFDWILSPDIEKLIDLFDHDFKGFLDTENLARNVLDPGFVINLIYNIKFHHDWHLKDLNFSIENCKENLCCMREKYQRRIRRFKNLDQYQGRVIFIRFEKDISASQAICFRNALDRFFPSLDFWVLLVTCVTDSNREVINEDRIWELKLNIASFLDAPSEDLQSFKEMLLSINHLDCFIQPYISNKSNSTKE